MEQYLASYVKLESHFLIQSSVKRFTIRNSTTAWSALVKPELTVVRLGVLKNSFHNN